MAMIYARLLRRALRRAGALARHRRLTFDGAPVLFANSFPKSGTHLLTQVLQGLPQVGLAALSGLPAVVTYLGDTGRARSETEIVADLRRFLPGDIGYGHVHALPAALDLLCRPGYAAYFILRDPRDVVVSHVHYVAEMAPEHIHHRYYTQELHTFEQRVNASIAGLPDPSVPFPNVRARFAPFLGWMNRTEVLSLRFEDFLADRQAALGRVLDHAVTRGFSLRLEREAALAVLAAGINPQRSPTFRSGKSGGWRAQFSAANVRLFKDITGDLLIQLGYEQDNDW